MSSIPQIPVEPLLAAPDLPDAAAACERILEAATGPGFMVLTGVDAGLGLPADAHERLLRFFDLP